MEILQILSLIFFYTSLLSAFLSKQSVKNCRWFQFSSAANERVHPVPLLARFPGQHKWFFSDFIYYKLKWLVLSCTSLYPVMSAVMPSSISTAFFSIFSCCAGEQAVPWFLLSLLPCHHAAWPLPGPRYLSDTTSVSSLHARQCPSWKIHFFFSR